MPTEPRLHFLRKRQDAFYRDVRADALAHLKTAGPSVAHPLIQAKAALLVLAAGACYAAALSADIATGWRFFLYAGFGALAVLIALNVGHEAAHGLLFRRRWANALANRLAFALVGVDGRMWTLRHLSSHHIYPNVLGCDADIDANYLLRLHPQHPRRAYQAWQHLYAPFVYLLVQPHSIFVQDVVYLSKDRLANLRGLRPRAAEITEFVAVKALHFAIALVLPWLATGLPFWTVLAFYALAGMLMSALFVGLLIGTHFADGNAFLERGADGAVDGQWAAHAVESSLDWSPRSGVAIHLAGGLNAHAAHHLFPRVSHRHYPALTAIVARQAARHGLAYRATGWTGMIAAHFRFLRALGRPAAP